MARERLYFAIVEGFAIDETARLIARRLDGREDDLLLYGLLDGEGAGGPT